MLCASVRFHGLVRDISITSKVTAQSVLQVPVSLLLVCGKLGTGIEIILTSSQHYLRWPSHGPGTGS